MARRTCQFGAVINIITFVTGWYARTSNLKHGIRRFGSIYRNSWERTACARALKQAHVLYVFFFSIHNRDRLGIGWTGRWHIVHLEFVLEIPICAFKINLMFCNIL